VSKHWNPEDERARSEQPRRWPAGATVGVVLVAACCVGAVLVLYQLAGPRDVFGS
jgi:hypothetical protein